MSDYVPWVVPGAAPCGLPDFWAMEAAEADRFLRTFVASIPERIEALGAFIASTSGFEDWRADGSPASLDAVTPWMLRVLERRRPAEQDPPQPWYVPRAEGGPPPPWVFADPDLARSVSVDVGMYIASCLQRERPKLRWARAKGKRDMDYNQPVLKGYCFSFEPYGLMRWTYEAVIRRDPALRSLAAWHAELLERASRQPRPKPVPIPKRDGPVVSSRCPRCGFSFARVGVPEGVYCNHCGHLETGAGAAEASG